MTRSGTSAKIQYRSSGAWRDLPPIIDTPDSHAEEFYELHSLSPRTPLGNISIAVLCITSAIAGGATGVFLTMLHYT